MSSQPPPIPFPLNPIFNVLDWIYNDTVLTVAIANKLYLQKAGDTATGLINFSAGLTATYAAFSGLVSTNNVLVFQDATVDTGNISGVSGSLVLTALTDMTFATNSSGVHPLILSTGTTTIQSNQINLTSSIITEIQTPNLDVYSPNSFTTYLQLLPTYAAGLADSAILYFGSTTQASNSYIGINSLTSMAMTISSIGSIVLNSAVDMVQLTTQPSGNVDAAVATVGYVNSGYIPIADGFPSGFIGQSLRTGANALPNGWVYCNGAQYPTTGIYANLFAVIGYSYGVAPLGQFFVPTIATQFLISSNNAGTGNIPSSNISNENSQTGGANTLNSSQLPAHTHTQGPFFNGSAGGGSYGQFVPDGKSPSGPVYFPLTSSAGSNATFSPPYFAAHFMIKL